jgi:hypothetical protein
MKPYKHIEESKKVLKTLVNEFKNMDNAKTRLTELNTLIKTVNDFEEMLVNKYHTDFFDVLLLNRLYLTLLKSKDEEINVKEFIMNFEQDFRFGGDYFKDLICSYLNHKQMYNSIHSNKVYTGDKSEWLKPINNLLKQIKTKIIFRKKWN